MSLTTRTFFSALLLIGFQAQAKDYSPSFFTKAIKDIELRSKIDTEDKTYNHSLRFSLSSLKSGAIFEALELERRSLQNENLYLDQKLRVETSRTKEESQIAQSWNRSLKKAYRDYRLFLKSNPEKEKNSLDLKAEKILSYAFLQQSNENTPVLSSSKLQALSLSKTSIDTAAKSIDSEMLTANANLKNQFRANSNLIKFLEIGVKNDEKFNEFSTPEFGFSLSLPLGFTGRRKEARLKLEIDKSKVRMSALDKKFRLVKSFDSFKQNQHLFKSANSLLKTRAQVRKIIKAISVTPVEILQLYLDTIDLHMASSKLKHDAYLQYNEYLFLSNAPAEKYSASSL